MPAAVIAAATTIGLEWIGTAIVGETFVLSNALIGKALFSAALSLVSESLRETPAQQSTPFSGEIATRKQLVRSSVEPRRVIYGQARVSGALMYIANGSDAQYVHMVIALAGHECQEIGAAWIGDEQVGDLDGNGDCISGTFAGHVRIRKYLGTATQVMDPDLAAECPEWGAKDRPGKGICYAYVRILRSRDVFPQGLQTPRFDVLGKSDILDVRTDTTGYTTNAALCALDYLRWASGFAAAADEIDADSWIAAANICDESVATPGGGSQARYAINGSFTQDRGRAEILDQMRQAMAGAVFYIAGRWTGAAGAADTPVMDLSEADLRGGYRIRPRVADDRAYNAVRGTYIETAQWTETDFPAVTNPLYEAEDGGQRLYKDVPLTFEIDAYRAQRLAKIDLERHRQGIVVDFPARIRALRLRPWSVVRLTLAAPGFTAKLFRVADWQLNLFGGADLVLEEYADQIYTWTSLDATTVDPAPDTNLQSGAVVQPPGSPSIAESLYQTTGSAGVKSRADATWAVVDSYPRWHRLSWRPAGGAWTSSPDLPAASYALPDLAPGNYEFRAATINGLGVVSPWSATTPKELLGLTAPPAAVSGFSVIASNGVAIGAWALSPDLDVRIGGRIVVRWTPLVSGALWENGIDVGDFNGDAVSGQLPMLTGTYLVKAKDSSSNWSAAAASFVLTAGNLVALPNSMTVTEHPAFTGAKSGTAANAGALALDGTTLIDSMVSLIDTWGYIGSLGGVASAGAYDFSNLMDFGSVVSRRITPTIQALAFDTGDLVDSRGVVDDWDSVDGAVINDATAQLLAAISTDAVSYGAWFPLPAGDVTCRSIKYRLALASAQPTHNIGISQLSVTANW